VLKSNRVKGLQKLVHSSCDTWYTHWPWPATNDDNQFLVSGAYQSVANKDIFIYFYYISQLIKLTTESS